MYWITSEAELLGYIFLRLMFDGFGGEDYATFILVYQLANTLYFFVVIPILNVNFKLHDSMVLFIILFVEGVGSIITGFSNSLWLFYLAQLFVAIGPCKYAMVNSLLSKCISVDEVGKVFSVLAIMSALAPVAGSTMFRSLFNVTNEVFVGAFYILSGVLGLLAALGNIYLFYHKKVLVNEHEEDSPSKQTFKAALAHGNIIRSHL